MKPDGSGMGNKGDAPFFSVLVPLFNHERYIGEALDSLLAQTDADWEAIVVDDGSTDRSGAVSDEYARKDSRFHIIHQSNGGQAVALNTALTAARGQWICWLSSDDLFLAEKLATHRRWIERYPKCGYFFTNFRTLSDADGAIASADQGRVPPVEWRVLDLLAYNYINGITICVRRDLMVEIGGFDPLNRYGQDYDLHLRLLTRIEAVHIPEETCVSRVHSEQYAQKENRAMFYDCAAAAIGLLNTTRFGDLFPSLDLSEKRNAERAVDRALDVAMSSYSYCNQMGPTPLLFMRIVEWISAQCEEISEPLWTLVEWRSLAFARTCSVPSREAEFWRVAALYTMMRPTSPAVVSVSPTDVADSALSWLMLRGDDEALAMRRYIEKRQGRVPRQCPDPQTMVREILVAGCVPDGIAEDLMLNGFRIARLERDMDGIAFHRWGYSLGIRSARRHLINGLALIPRWEWTVNAGDPANLGLASRKRMISAGVVDPTRLVSMIDAARDSDFTINSQRILRRVKYWMGRALTRQGGRFRL